MFNYQISYRMNGQFHHTDHPDGFNTKDEAINMATKVVDYALHEGAMDIIMNVVEVPVCMSC